MLGQNTDDSSDIPWITMIVFMRETLHRVTLTAYLQAQPQLQVLCQTSSLRTLVETLEKAPTDIVIFDANAAQLTSILQVIQKLRQFSPRTKIIALSSVPSVQVAVSLIDAQVMGIVYAYQDPKFLLQVIERAMHGTTTIPAHIAKEITLNRLSQINLTPRELETAIFVTQGLNNAEIAQKMGVMQSTIKATLWHIFAKLGIKSRTQLSNYIVRSGIVPFQDIPDPLPQQEA